jgi:predicted porin
VAKIIDEDTNVGIGLSYEYSKTDILGTSTKDKTFGGYLFGERAVLNPGPFKVFLRGRIGYSSNDDGTPDKTNTFDIGITPNVQYALSDRLTLIVSSDVLSLSFSHSKQGDIKTTNFGFNAGNNVEQVSVGLKYAF